MRRVSANCMLRCGRCFRYEQRTQRSTVATNPSIGTYGRTDPAPAPLVTEHDGVLVVRDDLFPGGTKARFLGTLFNGVDEVVYASPAEGGGQTALATVARRWATLCRRPGHIPENHPARLFVSRCYFPSFRLVCRVARERRLSPRFAPVRSRINMHRSACNIAWCQHVATCPYSRSQKLSWSSISRPPRPSA